MYKVRGNNEEHLNVGFHCIAIARVCPVSVKKNGKVCSIHYAHLYMDASKMLFVPFKCPGSCSGPIHCD